MHAWIDDRDLSLSLSLSLSVTTGKSHCMYGPTTTVRSASGNPGWRKQRRECVLVLVSVLLLLLHLQGPVVGLD